MGGVETDDRERRRERLKRDAGEMAREGENGLMGESKGWVGERKERVRFWCLI